MEFISVREWAENHGVPERTARMDTCLTAQDNFKILLDKFRIRYSDK